jgi:predicted GH43/DUF377 family glycosyl hydrolase
MTRQIDYLHPFFSELEREGLRFLNPARDAPLGVGVKYRYNPVLYAPSPTHHICHPQVVYSGDQFYMFYVHYDENRPPNACIDLATSQDGLVWTRHKENPVLFPTSGEWDSSRVSYHTIIKVGDIYHMYYTGTAAHGPANCRIGKATSDDLVNWKKHPDNPVFEHERGNSGGRQIQVPCVSIDKDVWNMLYMEQDGLAGNIALASSPDGLHWTRNPESPVLRTDQASWDGLRISPQEVIRFHGDYYLFYNGFDGDIYSAGIAISRNLIQWRKFAENPIVTVDRPSSWESRIVDHQFCLPFDGKYYVWYSAANDVTQHIGLAFLAEASSKKGTTR